MKCKIISILTVLLLVPMMTIGQTYQQLWKKVEEAQQKDLPQTALTYLQKIETKAQKEHAYGQLLKSTLLHSRLQAEVAPDSLLPAVKRLEQQLAQVNDIPLEAVYATVLSRVYAQNPQIDDDASNHATTYRKRAMAHPAQLARVKTDGYEPFVIIRKESEVFGHDLLSVVGIELDAWEWLEQYYKEVGNRRALCQIALRTAHDIKALDSLAMLYGDLPESSVIDKKRKNLWTVKTNPTYFANVPQMVMEVGKAQMVALENLRNLQSLTMHVYRTNLKGDTELDPNDEQDYKKMKSGLTELKELTQTRKFGTHQPDELFSDSLELMGLPAGVYMVEFASQPATQVSRLLYFVSGQRVMMLPLPQDRMRYVVVDATTGQPIANATLRLTYRVGWNMPHKKLEQACNLQGEVIIEQGKQRPSEVFVYTPSDSFCPAVNAYGRYNYYERQYNSEHTSLFTDRSIYRPGQTVHVAAIVWKEMSALDNIAVDNKQVKLELRDANYKLVAEQQIVTDRFGKCAATFTLPQGLLNGRFSIRANGASTSFSVEEYKRPTFQVEFSEYKDSYLQGDTVCAQGKATSYAGVPVQGGKVKYTVKRRVAFWWMSYSWYWQGGNIGRSLQDEIVYEGETQSANDGTFYVEMPLILPDDLKGQSMFYNFVVEADVTDEAGETHSGTMTLPLGTKPTALTCNLPQQVRKDQLPKVTFSRRNAAGKEIEGKVSYRIDDGKWKQTVANVAIEMSSMKSGQHSLKAICEQDTIDMQFVVFGLDDRIPATQTRDWFYCSHQQFPNDGSSVTMQVGSSDPDIHIVYALFAGGKEIESGALKLNGTLENRKLTYKEEYGSGLLLTYAWVKDGKCYKHTQTIMRPMPDKQLKLSWETFRNRLTPGQQEEWRLKIMTPGDKPAEASFLAVLYDKSLDQIKQHQWSFNPSTYLPQPSTSWQYRSWGSMGLSGAFRYKLLDIPSYSYSHFDDSVYPYYHYAMHAIGNRMYRTMAAAPMAESKAVVGSFDVMANDEASAEDNVVVGYGVKSAAERKEVLSSREWRRNQTEQQQEQVQLRENLNETAFCYPVLETDKEGGVTLKFTLPESLTTWRFMGVANTQEMLYGAIEGETVAKKDVMIQPNMPRFVRMGDEAQISARIFNTGEKVASGKAKLQLTDPETNQVVYEQEQPFSVEVGKTGAVMFNVPCKTFNASLLVCKVSAVGEGFSDGEQHFLPVLPDREYVTKTVPYTQHETGVKSIDLTKLFPAGTTQQKLTIEYTNNPAWLMIQSLATVGQPWEHSAIDQAASYYSNLLAKTILKQSTQVKTVFEQWKRETGTEQTLQSQLEKNQELKDLVLAETPWVHAADREAEQKKHLADFFDQNGINNRLSIAVEKLKKLQNPDGSFSWYPGMQGSVFITVAVEEMLVRLTQMTGEQDGTVSHMQDKAFDYIGKEMVEQVTELKKQEKKGHKPSFPSFTALRWLYLCAIDGRQLSSSVKTANDYLIVLLDKDIKRQSIYEKALTAIVLSKHGKGKKAQEYVQSLKEYTVCTEEMGRYYDTPRASYSWYDYKIPTEVAAIEAIQTVMPKDQQTVDEMRRWLLQEKRTQAWDTPINSVNAIWAFLSSQNGQNTLNNLGSQNAQTVLAIDGKPVKYPVATAGVGYVKTAINDPQGHTFTSTKTSEGNSWGAVYAQFLQKTSDIETSQSGISVKRELLTVHGEKLTDDHWRVGDRIKVRVTIETTRDLDFVQVVDRRAACMEPVRQLSGYQQGAYISPKDYATNYYYYGLAKGKHVIETEYYIDRAGQYDTGTCTVQCAYAPEYRATAPSMTMNVK